MNDKKKPAAEKKSSVSQTKRLAFQGGTYSLIITAVVLAILIVANVFVSVLPSHLTTYDISASKLYSITSNTKAVVNALQKDVTIYWIVQGDQEDDIIANLLDKYDSLSEHITVEKRNPDIYPTFAQQYTDEDVANNSLVVECGDRFRYIPYTDIYLQEAGSSYSYSYTTSFDGEGAITSAIDYVVNAELPKMYLLEGHGETDLPETFADQVEKANIETAQLSLATENEVPEDAACVMIYNPQSDIADKEKDILADYAKAGGKLLVCAGPVQDATLDNLYAILGDYGVKPVEGIVVDTETNHFAFREPLMLRPDMASSPVTDSLIEERYFCLMPISIGLDTSEADDSVTALLTTSEESFSKKAAFEMSTYDKEDGDIDGPFALAVSVDCGNDGSILWFSSSSYLEDQTNAFSSGANGDMTMNAVASLVGESEAMAIRSKSLNYNYLTISDSASTLLTVLMVGAFPLAYLGVGIAVVMRRRKAQHEAV